MTCLWCHEHAGGPPERGVPQKLTADSLFTAPCQRPCVGGRGGYFTWTVFLTVSSWRIFLRSWSKSSGFVM